MADKGFLVVHFDDVAYTTISAPMDSTVPQICTIVAKRRNLNPQMVDSFGLFVREQEGDSLLTGTELPLQIQDSLTRKGQMDHVKFIFRELDTGPAPQQEEGEESEGSEHDEPSIFGSSAVSREGLFDANPTLCSGFLEKRGKLNKAFRGRWFVLQPAKLYYFKTRESKLPQSYILLEDVAVREQPQRKPSEFIFELVTTARVFQMKAKSYSEMFMWISAIKQNCELELNNYIMDDVQLWMFEDSFDRANADELAREQVSTLAGCLANHVAQSALMQFAVENHSAENLLFWIDVEKYRELFAKQLPGLDMKEVATKIVTEYLAPGSRHEISVEGKYRTALIADIKQGKNISVDLFLTLQNQAFSHMETTIFPRFQTSKQFNTALVFLNGQSTKDLSFEDVAYKHPPPPSSLNSPGAKVRKEPKKKGRLSITKSATLPRDMPLPPPPLASSSSTPNLMKGIPAPPPEKKGDDAANSGRWKPKTIFDSIDEEGDERKVMGSPEDSLFGLPGSMPGLTNASGRSAPPTSLFDDDDDETERFRRKDSNPGIFQPKQSRNVHYMVSTPTETNPLAESLQNSLSLSNDSFLSSFSRACSPPPPNSNSPVSPTNGAPGPPPPRPLAASSALSASAPALSSLNKKPPLPPPKASTLFFAPPPPPRAATTTSPPKKLGNAQWVDED